MNTDILLLKALRDKLRLTASLPETNSQQILKILEKIMPGMEFNVILNAPESFSPFQFACYLDRVVNTGVVLANRLLIKSSSNLGLSVYASEKANQYRIVGKCKGGLIEIPAICEFMHHFSDALDGLITSIEIIDKSPEDMFFNHLFSDSTLLDTPEKRIELIQYFVRLSAGEALTGIAVPYGIFRLVGWLGSDIEYHAREAISLLSPNIENEVGLAAA